MRCAVRLLVVLILALPFAPHSLRAQTRASGTREAHATLTGAPSVRGGKMQTALR